MTTSRETRLASAACGLIALCMLAVTPASATVPSGSAQVADNAPAQSHLAVAITVTAPPAGEALGTIWFTTDGAASGSMLRFGGPR